MTVENSVDVTVGVVVAVTVVRAEPELTVIVVVRLVVPTVFVTYEYCSPME